MAIRAPDGANKLGKFGAKQLSLSDVFDTAFFGQAKVKWANNQLCQLVKTWPKHLLVMKMFSCSAVTACQVPCHSLQVSQELQMLSSLNLYSIVNLLRIMASLGILFWGLQFVNIHGGGGFLFRKLKVSAGRCGRWRSRNPLLCLFSFVEKRDFSILDRSINIY